MPQSAKWNLLASTAVIAVMLSAPAHADLLISSGTTTSTTTLTGASGSNTATVSSTAVVQIGTSTAPTAGGNAINVTGDATSVAISTYGSSSINAGAGGAGATGTAQAGAAGGTALNMTTATGTALIHESVLQNSSTSISGGIGGAGGSSTVAGSGASGGAGGLGGQAINSAATYSSVTLLTGSINAGAGGIGGAGQSGVTGTTGTIGVNPGDTGGSGGTGGTGGNGGAGGAGNIAVTLSGANSTLTQAAGTTIAGGAGGTSGVAGVGGVGGTGGAGATGTTGADGGTGTGGTGGTGGAGGAGGSGGAAGNGANGGSGGHGVSLAATNITATFAGTVTGGAGQAGSAGGSGGSGGAGGAGGVGGNGGTGGTTGATGATGADGATGATNSGTGSNGNGGHGGDAVNVAAGSTGINITVTGTLQGGAGGAAGGVGAVAGYGGAGIAVGNLGSGNTGIISVNGGTINGGLVGDGSGLYRAALDFSANTGNMNVTLNNATVQGLLLSNSTTVGGDVINLTGTNTIDSEIYTSANTPANNGTINVISGTTTVTLAIGITSTGALSAINIEGTSTLSGGDGVYSTAVNFTGDGVLTMNSTGTQILLGTVTTTGGTAGMGTINSNNTTGTDTFDNTIGSSTNYVKAININGTGTTTSLSSVYAASLAFTADGLYIAAAPANTSTITAVTTATTNTGSVISANTSNTNTFGEVGSSTALLKSFTVNGGGTGITNVTGDLYATAATVSSGNTLNIGGSTSGTVDGGASNTGIVNYIGSTGTVSGNVGSSAGLSALTFGNGTTSSSYMLAANLTSLTTTLAHASSVAIGTSGITIKGALVSNGTLNLGNYATTVTGNITGANSAISTTIGASSNGNIINTTNTINPTFTNALTVNTNINGGAIASGNSIVLIHATQANSAVALPTTTINVTGTSALISWAASTATTSGTDMYGNAIHPDDIILTATAVSPTAVTGVSSSALPGINALLKYNGSNADTKALLSSVESLSAAGLNTAGAQLAPETNAASQTVAFGTIQKALGTVVARMDNVRTAQAARSGISSGETLAGYGFWAQGFGMDGHQGSFDGVDGYSSSTYGTALGGDTRVNKNTRVGASMTFAKSTVNDEGAQTGSSLKINSYVGSVYASYKGTPWYVDANAIFGVQTNTSTRLIDFNSSTVQTAMGNYGSQQYGLNLGVGYPFAVAHNMSLAPVGSLLYTHLNQNAYTETGASGADLRVDANSTDSLVSATGLKFAALVGDLAGWSFIANTRAMWLHEFNNKAANETATYASSGGTTFVTPGVTIPADTGELGLGMDFTYKQGVTVSVKYDLDLRKEYVGNGGMLQVRKDF